MDVDFLARLTPEQRTALVDIGRRRRLSRGAVLVSEGARRCLT